MTTTNMPAHLKAENILRAFNKNMSEQEIAERAKLMRDPSCTSERITELNHKFKTTK